MKHLITKVESLLKPINKEKPDFAFIDTIRFISMAAIVYEHASLFIEYLKLKSWEFNNNEAIVSSLYINAGKFGTIIFFLIAGFLIHSKTEEYTAKQYLSRRVNNIFKPWFIFTLIFLVLIFFKDFIKYKIGRGHIEYHGFIPFFFEKITETIFYSSFWFVLNLFICICILFLFKKYLYKLATGFFFAACTFFYSINIYRGQFPTEHTTAIFGFIFFLWLGLILHKNYTKFKNWISNTSYLYLGLLVFATFSFSVIESVYLIKIGSNDPFNTLRISNIFFSLSSFLLLMKVGDIKVINKFKPRQSTFGIYLVHMIMILLLIPLLFGSFKLNGGQPILKLSLNQLVNLSFLRFIIIYTASYFFVRFIATTKFCWAIGIKKRTDFELTPSTAESVPHFEAVLVPIDRQRTLLPD